MKKLQLLMIAILSTTAIKADLNYGNYRQFGEVAQARRTHDQKAAYKQSKIDKGASMETAEFRFALKLSEYYGKLLSGDMKALEFIEEISRKVQNYLNNKENHSTHEEKAAFLNEYLKLSLEDLQDRVGTIETPGSMQRYVDQRN